MRTLILFLILVNLAFYYWVNIDNEGDVIFETPQSVENYSPILLLSERKQDQEQQLANSSLTKKPGQLQTKQDNEKETIELKCYSLGPFADEEKSNEIYNKLLSSGIQAKQRLVNERLPKSYWVYLKKRPSQQEADNTVELLKQHNINEYYIWLEPPHKYAVSLGLFKELSTATKKMTQVGKIGLNPQMQVRFNEISEYWVDINHNAQQSQPAIIEEMLVKNDRMLILETKCL